MESKQILMQNANGYFWFLLSTKRHLLQFDVLWQDSVTRENLTNPVYFEECIKDPPCLFNFSTIQDQHLKKCPCCNAQWKTVVKDKLLENITKQVKDILKKPLYIRFKDSTWAILGPNIQYHPFDWVVLQGNQAASLISKIQNHKFSKMQILTIESQDQDCLVAIFQGDIYMVQLDNDEAVKISFIFQNEQVRSWSIAVLHKGVFVGYANGIVYTSELLHQKLDQNSYQLTFGISQKNCQQISIYGNDLWTVDKESVIKQYSNYLYSFENCITHKDLSGKILINQQGEVITLSVENDSIVVQRSQQQIDIDVGEYTNLTNYGIVYAGLKIFLLSYKPNISSLEICLQPIAIKKIKTIISKPLSELHLSDIICRYIDEDLKLKQLLLKS